MEYHRNESVVDLGNMDVEAEQRSAIEEVIAYESIEMLYEALRMLPQRDAFIIWEKDIEGMKHEQIASFLGLNPGTVRARYHRAIPKLIRALEKLGY